MTKTELDGLFKMLDRNLETMNICTTSTLTIAKAITRHLENRSKELTEKKERDKE